MKCYYFEETIDFEIKDEIPYEWSFSLWEIDQGFTHLD